ncbi:lipoprotein signal peptidase [Agaricicola taiwanensis]|uniref:Lipoprotein signal peptidase n=1 Tax=Agaricicola taiwanensis TaxID=591372 RepID=A0A8J2YG81_9RHOB|nr:signal peptidase II [Agaricicola taiwanensis]GGE34311.1 lipoprotein signal peptidase [Agaricicola taiwanensis]
MTATRLGVIITLITLVLDQASKLWVLFSFDLPLKGRVAIAPFVDFVMVWNRGISYGLMQQDGDLGRWLLIIVTVIAVVFLANWLRKEDGRINAAGLGLIIGGAVGNGIDRVVYGAVADFVLLHAGNFEWYVFNIADAAIVVGVVFLLYGALKIGRDDERSRAEEPGTNTTT